MSEVNASPAQRRTQRQHQAVEDGLNPLTMQPQHQQAPNDCSAKDRHLRRYTCGTCAFLLVLNTGRGRTLKCGYADGQRISYGPATAIRGWWPACQQYEPDLNTFPNAGP